MKSTRTTASESGIFFSRLTKLSWVLPHTVASYAVSDTLAPPRTGPGNEQK